MMAALLPPVVGSNKHQPVVHTGVAVPYTVVRTPGNPRSTAPVVSSAGASRLVVHATGGAGATGVGGGRVMAIQEQPDRSRSAAARDRFVMP
jgi:hypothetical protein